MRRSFCFFAFGLAVASALAACSDDPKRPPHAVDPSVQPGNPITGGPGEGGVADSSVAPDANTACHDLPLTGVAVQETGVVGEPQPGTGGALAEGVYDLIEAQKFVAVGGTPGPTGVTFRASMRINGQVIDRWVQQDGVDRVVRGTFATNGTTITYAVTCPVQSQEQLTYTVNGNNLTLTDVVARTSFTFVKK